VVLVLIIGVVLVGTGVALLVHGWTFSRGGTAESLGQIKSYGFAAEPLGDAGRGPQRRPLVTLAAGMYETDPLTIVGYRVLGAAVGTLGWIWLSATLGVSFVVIILGAAVLGVLGWMAPVVLITRRARLRTERIDYELPELIDLLVVTLEAGLSFLASLHMAASRITGPLGAELRLMLQEQRMGLAVNDALESMLRRCETPALRTFVRSVLQGESLGVSTGQIMRNLAVEMRKRRRAKAEERAQKAPIKILFPLIFLIFPALFIVLLGPAVYALSKAFGGG
jgi:tight adherence protein C